VAQGEFELGTDGPKTILVGVDGSVTATRAAWYAAGMARRERAEVVAVYVAGPLSVSAAAAGAAGAALQAQSELADQIREAAQKGAAELGLELTFIHVEGDPFTRLSEIADHIRADAVVVGASTKAGHRLVGSLALRLVRAGKWPVTVVP
jgi:nucleotide-binding universal stress UspA family protein